MRTESSFGVPWWYLSRHNGLNFPYRLNALSIQLLIYVLFCAVCREEAPRISQVRQAGWEAGSCRLSLRHRQQDGSAQSCTTHLLPDRPPALFLPDHPPTHPPATWPPTHPPTCYLTPHAPTHAPTHPPTHPLLQGATKSLVLLVTELGEQLKGSGEGKVVSIMEDFESQIDGLGIKVSICHVSHPLHVGQGLSQNSATLSSNLIYRSILRIFESYITNWFRPWRL